MAVKLRGKCLLGFILKTRNKQEHFNVTLTAGMISYLKCMRGSLQNFCTSKHIWRSFVLLRMVSMKRGNLYGCSIILANAEVMFFRRQWEIKEATKAFLFPLPNVFITFLDSRWETYCVTGWGFEPKSENIYRKKAHKKTVLIATFDQQLKLACVLFCKTGHSGWFFCVRWNVLNGQILLWNYMKATY